MASAIPRSNLTLRLPLHLQYRDRHALGIGEYNWYTLIIGLADPPNIIPWVL